MWQRITAGSWKTTSMGLSMIIGAFVHLYFVAQKQALTESDVVIAVGAVLGGVGLLVARDNDKTSEDVGAKKET
jgi:hypothetical protein